MTKCNCPEAKDYYSKPQDLLKLIEENKGIKLDMGCGSNKQEGYIGLDIRPLPNVEIVHDVELVPYPLPDECCIQILASHLVEHICPKNFVDVMNEWWRLLKPNGQLLISAPYGRSFGFYQDPTHCNPCNEATWAYFDPTQFLYSIYRPKPWRIERNAWWENGNMEVILSKMTEEEAEKIKTPQITPKEPDKSEEKEEGKDE